VKYFTQPCSDWFDCPPKEAGKLGNYSSNFPIKYEINTIVPGIYYGTCIFDIGCNAGYLPDEDIGALMNGGQPIVVPADGVVSNMDCAIPAFPKTASLLSGTFNCGGNPKEGCIKLTGYSAPCLAWNECPKPPSDGVKFDVKSCPYGYMTATFDPGTYYIICTMDIGCNNDQAPGPEDSGSVANGGKPVLLEAGKETSGVDCTIPEPVKADSGCVAGSVNWTGQTSVADSLQVFVAQDSESPGKPSYLTMLKPVKFPAAYSVCGIPVGSWYVMAMFDKNGDTQGPPKAGDVSGIYKSTNEKVMVSIAKDQTSSGIDFELGK